MTVRKDQQPQDHAHAHDQVHDHDHNHDHQDQHGGDDHMHADAQHGHTHDNHAGGWLGALFHSHSHSGPATDRAFESNERGIWALKISLIGLFATALLQSVVVWFSGSAALLADTVHNFGDALTAIPIWIAFVIGRRPANRRYTYGYRRAEDVAGIVVVLMMAASAALAGWESYRKLVSPEPLQHLGWVMAAAVVGFVGNELVAMFRIRVGREIGSAALEADGQHARVDGLTSLAVLLGAFGVWLGFPQADPIVGLLITIPILLVLYGAAKTIWERLMDAVDPQLVDKAEQQARTVSGVQGVHDVRMRWMGHNLETELHIEVDCQLPTADSHRIAQEVEHTLLHALPRLERVIIHVDPVGRANEDFHSITAHHSRGS